MLSAVLCYVTCLVAPVHILSVLQLLTASGMISPASSPGTFHLLPMFMRSLEKLTRIIDQELRAVGCQKLSMPALQDASIWKSSGKKSILLILLCLPDETSFTFC